MTKSTLKISISPRDIRLLEYTLPHQLSFWHDEVDEVLLVLDLHGYDSLEHTVAIDQILTLSKTLSAKFKKLRLVTVDYSKMARKIISDAYFGGRRIPEKTHRYGPYYSYFYGLFHCSYDYVLNIDSDILFGGSSENWISEAISLLNESSVITCSPLPGAPRADGRLLRQAGQIEANNYRSVTFNSFSSRIFFIHKPKFQRVICPIPVRIAKFSLFIRALLRGKPVYELPEDTISQIMLDKGLQRIDFLGSQAGAWTLHPPYRNEEFYASLPQIISRVEMDQIPEEQRGDYDINYSMVNWDNAKAAISEASLKKKVKRILRLSLR